LGRKTDQRSFKEKTVQKSSNLQKRGAGQAKGGASKWAIIARPWNPESVQEGRGARGELPENSSRKERRVADALISEGRTLREEGGASASKAAAPFIEKMKRKRISREEGDALTPAGESSKHEKMAKGGKDEERVGTPGVLRGTRGAVRVLTRIEGDLGCARAGNSHNWVDSGKGSRE